MATFREKQKKVSTERQNLARLEADLYEARLQAGKGDGSRTPASVASRLADAQRAVADAKVQLQRFTVSLSERTSYTEVARELDAGIPVLLLPVRMETRLVSVDNRQQLWLRVYPDDIHIESFEERLTKAEIRAGRAYWLQLLRANRESAADSEDDKKDVWKKLVKKAGVQRALWITRKTRPTNWEPDLEVNDDQLEFPPSGEAKTHDWTRAPRTRILPDRFVVQIHNDLRSIDDPALAPIIGNPLPDTVFTGPDPFLAKKAFKASGKSIELDESFSWITDFDQAVKQGLGFKIPIKDEYLNHGRIDRITVLGLMASADPLESQAILEEHIHAHRYSSKGFSFLPQGAQTNNTSKSDSAYSLNYDDLPNGYYDGNQLGRVADKPDSDAFQFARLLGIDADVLDGVKHAEKQEIREARSMNEALYPATIGYFLSVLSQPAVSKSAQPEVKRFFTENVSATGPLSAIRVGDQPYGVLVTSDLRAWREVESFYARAILIFRSLQTRWNAMMKTGVAHVNTNGDAAKILLEILGLGAGSVSFRQRLGHLHDFILSAANVTHVSGQLAVRQNAIMTAMKDLGYAFSSFPFISNLSFYGKSEHISPDYMVDRKRPSRSRYLDKLEEGKLNYIQWLESVRSIAELDNLDTKADKPPRSVLFLLLRHALLLELQSAATGVYRKGGYALDAGVYEKSLYNFNTRVQDLNSWEVLHSAPNKVDAAKLGIASALGDHLLKMRANSLAVAGLTGYRRALQQLAPLSTYRLHQCLADHIDLCSYRLDAWQTGLFRRRLEQKRSEKRNGLYIGAYGWVENLKIVPKKMVDVPQQLQPEDGQAVFESPSNAGFVHTPSLNHATAAGVLHSGYSQQASQKSPGDFAVNLSSDRVRRALFLYEGVQNNQPLEALLGYQFERALHDLTSSDPANNLNQYILALRRKYPVEHASIPQRGTEAQEVTPVYAVVNGLKVIKASKSSLRSLGVEGRHIPLILAETDRLADSLDAIGDLLTSETAYQMVQGKTERTAAVLNSLKDVDLPPELEVHKTPRSTHLSITNRVCIQFSGMESQALTAGWKEKPTPRAILEPGINAWLSAQIGRPDRIMCAAAVIDDEGAETGAQHITLADLDIQPIDLVYAAGLDVQSGANELEQLVYRYYTSTVRVPRDKRVRIRFDVPGLESRQRSYSQVLPLLRLLRLLITTGHAADARDFFPHSAKQTRNAQKRAGWAISELVARTDAAVQSLKKHLQAADKLSLNQLQPTADVNPATVGELFRSYRKKGRPEELFDSIQLTKAEIQSLMSFIEGSRLFGIKVNVPDNVKRKKQSSIVSLLQASAYVWDECNRKIGQASAKRSAADQAQYDDRKKVLLVEAVQSVVDDDFQVLAKFRFRNRGDIASTIGEKGKQLLKYWARKEKTSSQLAVETWMESVSPVRPAMARLEQIRMIAEFSGGAEMRFAAAQLPYKRGDSWLAVEFPELNEQGEPFDITDDTICLCVHGLDKNNVSGQQAVMIIDEWSEAVPGAKEVTGISYNYNQPNSTAPNALLLAVEPTGSTQWDWNVLQGIVDDTLQRAKTRAVEPAHILKDPALSTLVPMTIAGFDLHNSGISLDYLTVDDDLFTQMKAGKYELYNHFGS